MRVQNLMLLVILGYHHLGVMLCVCVLRRLTWFQPRICCITPAPTECHALPIPSIIHVDSRSKLKEGGAVSSSLEKLIKKQDIQEVINRHPVNVKWDQ